MSIFEMKLFPLIIFCFVSFITVTKQNLFSSVETVTNSIVGVEDAPTATSESTNQLLKNITITTGEDITVEGEVTHQQGTEEEKAGRMTLGLLDNEVSGFTSEIESKNTSSHSNEGADDSNVTQSTTEKQFNRNLTEEKFRFQNASNHSAFDNTNDTLHDDPLEFNWRKREDAFTITLPEQFPYSVLLLMIRQNEIIGFCSGSIITPQWVLTASHCLDEWGDIIVYAGGNSKQEFVDYKKKISPLPSTAQVLWGAQKIKHPGFTEEAHDCDVGLIRVEGRFNMTAAVNVARLATAPWDREYHTYTTCNMTGFGVVQIGEKSKEDSHRKTYHLDVKHPCLCSFRLQIMFGRRPASRYICTRPKKDYGVCPGDSGGGLVCGGKIRGVAMQIVKLKDTEYCDMALLAPLECGGANTLSVFEDICPFLPWINSHVNLFNESQISPKCKYVAGSPSVKNKNSILLLTITNIVIILIKMFFC